MKNLGSLKILPIKWTIKILLIKTSKYSSDYSTNTNTFSLNSNTNTNSLIFYSNYSNTNTNTQKTVFECIRIRIQNTNAPSLVGTVLLCHYKTSIGKSFIFKYWASTVVPVQNQNWLTIYSSMLDQYCYVNTKPVLTNHL